MTAAGESALGNLAVLGLAVHAGEQGVVAALHHVQSRLERGTALADQDRSGVHGLAVADLYAEPLAARVATESGSTACFSVGHGSGSFEDE